MKCARDTTDIPDESLISFGAAWCDRRGLNPGSVVLANCLITLMGWERLLPSVTCGAVRKSLGNSEH